MKTGVYKITNWATKDCYIGSCADRRGGIEHRWRKHETDLGFNRHHSIKLQRAWNKYGGQDFRFEVLLYCDPENCLMYEQLALDYYKPKYNICKKAGSCLGRKLSKEAKLKISKANGGRKHSSVSKQRMSTTRKSRGSKRGENNSSAKLTTTKVKQIRLHLEQGSTMNYIAYLFGVSVSTISDIKHHRTWRHL